MKAKRFGWILLAIGILTVIAVRTAPRQGHSAARSAAEAQKGTYYCPMHPTYTSDRPGDCPICNMRLVKKEETKEEKRILYWTDPMIPGYKSDKPGKSPMGMEMVPVYEGGMALGEAEKSIPGYAAVQLNPQKRQMIGLKTAPAAKRAMVRTIRTVGRIAYDPELYQTQQEYLQAQRALEKARGMGSGMEEQAQQLVDSARLRLRILGLSEPAIQEMADWKEPDRSLLLSDGNGQVWLYAPIYEYELPLVQIGQTVRAEASALPGQAFEGVIQSIDSVLDPGTRSARVRAILKDPEGVLRPEMYVNAGLQMDLGSRLAVPQEAVLDSGTRRILFVDRGEGVLEPREVEVGTRAEGYVEILKGVQEGEPVVVNGNFLLDSESRLKAALEGMGEGGSHVHGQ